MRLDSAKRPLHFLRMVGVVLCAMAPLLCHAQANREWGLRAIQTVTGLTQPASTLTSEQVPVNFGGSKPAAATPTANQRQKVADARPMAVSVREYGMGTMTKTEIIQAAKAIMSTAKANQIAGIIKGVMGQGKVGSGVFIYEQQVSPKGAVRDMKLTWAVTVTENGFMFAGDPKVVDPDPTTVYMLYTSLAAEAGLPSSWTHADAGVLKWQLRKLDGTPATAWSTVNTGGAFDETADAEFKVNCLANKTTAGCPAGYVDAKTLMAETASAAAMIDYVRKVAPAYDESIDASTGETIYQPQVSVSYDRREYDRTGCSSGNFRNIGRRGYTLKTTVDRYQMSESDQSATRINRFEGTSLSPTENFDVSKTLEMTSQSLSNQVIDSFTSNLVASSSIRGLQYVAPITTYSTLTNANNLRLESTQSDMAMSWVPGGNGNYSLNLGTIGDNYWSGWGAVYDRSMTFNISNKDLFSKFSLADAAFDDWLMVQVNGQVAYVGPYGGDRLNIYQQTTNVYAPNVCQNYTSYDEWGSANTYAICGNQTLMYDGEGGSYYGWVNAQSYNSCSAITGGYQCVVSNPNNGKVQYGPNSFGWPELRTNWRIPLNVDLRSYLRSGTNTIATRTIVAGRGEGIIRIDATSCLPD